MNVYLLFNFSENLTNNVSSGSHVLMKLICLYQGNTTGPDKTDSQQTHYSGKECEWNKCNAVSDQGSCILFEGKMWPS